jgi:hypothetical protein
MRRAAEDARAAGPSAPSTAAEVGLLAFARGCSCLLAIDSLSASGPACIVQVRQQTLPAAAESCGTAEALRSVLDLTADVRTELLIRQFRGPRRFSHAQLTAICKRRSRRITATRYLGKALNNVADRVSPADALAAACAAVGLSSEGSEVLYSRSNTVYRLAGVPIVARLRYAHGSRLVMERLTASVQVTAWLHERGFPTVTPIDFEQPVEIDGYIATFWQLIDATRPPWEDVDSLGRLLRLLHEVGTPDVPLPATSPLGTMLEDTTRCSWLDEHRKSWLLDRLNELQRRYETAAWTLGLGLIHGDAYAENIIHTRSRPVLGDWDSVSYGPREQDIVPTSIRYRFGRPSLEWRRFCAAYGVNPEDSPGLALLREMREVRTLVPYVRTIGNPAAQAEVRRRIDDLMSGTQKEPWQALNFAL